MDFKITKQITIQDDVFDARFHPIKEDLVAAATIGGSIYLIENGEIKSTMKKHHKGTPIRRVRFDKEGRMISAAKTIKVHDLESNQTKHTLKRNDEDKSSFNAILPLGPSAICAGDDSGKVFIWDTRESVDAPIFSASDCDQYISDIDGKFESRRMFVCTSGEGTLTAYDLRANKMIEPQSELFEAGFQCVKMVDTNKKVVVGGEDGAVYVFNHNEWAHTSGKFAISDDAHNRGKCSIEAIDCLADSSIFLVACSDGKMRSLTLWPHQILRETIVCKRRSLECLQVNPMEGKSQIVVGGENYLNLLEYEEKSEDEMDKNESDAQMSELNETSSADTSESSDESNCGGDAASSRAKTLTRETSDDNNGEAAKKPKVLTDDYLNIFK